MSCTLIGPSPQPRWTIAAVFRVWLNLLYGYRYWIVGVVTFVVVFRIWILLSVGLVLSVVGFVALFFMLPVYEKAEAEREVIRSWTPFELELRCEFVLLRVKEVLFDLSGFVTTQDLLKDLLLIKGGVRQELGEPNAEQGSLSSMPGGSLWSADSLAHVVARLRHFGQLGVGSSADGDKITTFVDRITLTPAGAAHSERLSGIESQFHPRLGDTYVEDKSQTVHLGDGTQISAPFVIAHAIKKSVVDLASSNLSHQLESLVNDLLRQVAAISALPELPEKAVAELARDVTAATTELAASEPRPDRVRTALSHVEATASSLGRVAQPILQTVEAISKLF